MMIRLLVCVISICLAIAEGDQSFDIKVSDDGNNRVMVAGPENNNVNHGNEQHENNGQQNPNYERVGYTRDHYNFQPNNQATVHCENCNNNEQNHGNEVNRNNEVNHNNNQQHEPIRNNNEPIRNEPNHNEPNRNEPIRNNNEINRPNNNNINREENLGNNNELVLNRIDHRDAAMYEMNQQQMHKMDSLDNKLTRFSTITQQQLDALRTDLGDIIRRIENIDWLSSKSEGRLQQLMSDMQYMRVTIETHNADCNTINPFSPKSPNSLPSIDSRLQSIGTLVQSTRSAINQLQQQFHRFEGTLPTVSITGMMPPYCPPGCIQYVATTSYIPPPIRQSDIDITYDMQPPPFLSIHSLRPGNLVRPSQPFDFHPSQINPNPYVPNNNNQSPPLLNITHAITPPSYNNRNPTKTPLYETTTKPPMPTHPPTLKHPTTTTTLQPPPMVVTHQITVVPPMQATVTQIPPTPLPPINRNKPPLKPKLRNKNKSHHNATQSPATNIVPKPLIPQIIVTPPSLPHITTTPPAQNHFITKPPVSRPPSIAPPTRLPPQAIPPKRIQQITRNDHFKRTENNIWMPVQNDRNHPPENHGPINHPPENHPPENHPLENHPPENHPPENRQPENHPPENHPPQNHPPQNHPPENRQPENHPPENHPPQNHPPENHPPENHQPENHPPENHPPENHPPQNNNNNNNFHPNENAPPMQPSPQWNGPVAMPVPVYPVPMYSGFVPSSPLEVTELDADKFPSNCNDIPSTQSGAYQIKLNDGMTTPFYIYCEMRSPNNKWAVVMNRENGSTEFHRNWQDYKNGFGNLVNEFWMGLDNLYQMTANNMHELLIDMEDWDGNTRYARYSNFAIGNENDGYPLRVLGTYDGTAGDSMTYHAGQKFSTFDQDNDGWPEGNCAKAHTGAWWYNSCDMCNLNGRYLGEDASSSDPYQGVYWNDFRGPYYSLKRAKMMIRPVTPY